MSVLPAAQRILVTGADGLLGRHVLETWRGSRDIHALVRRAPDRPIEGVSYIAMDLAGPLDFARLPARVDAVIHLAQSPHMRDFPDAASDIYAVNTASTAGIGGIAYAAPYASAKGGIITLTARSIPSFNPE